MRRVHIFLDCALVGLAALIAFSLRDQIFIELLSRSGLGLYILATVLFGAIVFSAMRINRSLWRYFSLADALHVTVAMGVVVLLSWSSTFLIDRSELIPRSVPVLHWAIGTFLMCCSRVAARFLARTPTTQTNYLSANPARHVLVVGSDDLAELYIRCTKRLAKGRVVVAGLLAENTTLEGRSVLGTPVLGRPSQVDAIVNTQSVHGITIDKIVLAQSFASLSAAGRQALRDFEKQTGHELEFFEDRLGFNSHEVHKPVASTPAAQPIASAQGVYPRLKRAMDASIALLLLILFLPLILLVWIATLIDVGSPAFFWQVRPGLSGKPFRVLKFRTMRGAHDALGRRIPDDQRLSGIGAALRQYRLDELPQLLNILNGDMSFIGPRPLLPVDQPENAAIRMSVRPGLTGWAQVNGGRIISAEDKAALDAWYVKNISLGLDLRIACMTIKVLLVGEKVPPKQVLTNAHRVVSQNRLRGADS